MEGSPAEARPGHQRPENQRTRAWACCRARACPVEPRAAHAGMPLQRAGGRSRQAALTGSERSQRKRTTAPGRCADDMGAGRGRPGQAKANGAHVRDVSRPLIAHASDTQRPTSFVNKRNMFWARRGRRCCGQGPLCCMYMLQHRKTPPPRASRTARGPRITRHGRTRGSITTCTPRPGLARLRSPPGASKGPHDKRGFAIAEARGSVALASKGPRRQNWQSN